MYKVRHRYIGRTMAALLAAALLLSGCGDPSRTSGSSGQADPAGEESEEAVNYRITERLIPSPEEELYKEASDNEIYLHRFFLPPGCDGRGAGDLSEHADGSKG